MVELRWKIKHVAILQLLSTDREKRSNLRAAVDEDHGGMLPARHQVVRLVQHAIQQEARLPREAENLRRIALEC